MAIRNSQMGNQDAWSRDDVVDGIKKFLEENKRFPKAVEFKSCPYLPTVRSIQRTFGGLIHLKKELGVTENYHSGEYRSAIAKKINLRGQDDERRLGTELENIFGEVCVHYQGLAGSKKERFDFVVFHTKGRFGVDTFFPSDVINLGIIVGNKQKKYLLFSGPIFFVVMNEEITEDQILQILEKKDNQLRENISVLTHREFLKRMGDYQRLRNL